VGGHQGIALAPRKRDRAALTESGRQRIVGAGWFCWEMQAIYSARCWVLIPARSSTRLTCCGCPLLDRRLGVRCVGLQERHQRPQQGGDLPGVQSEAVADTVEADTLTVRQQGESVLHVRVGG